MTAPSATGSDRWPVDRPDLLLVDDHPFLTETLARRFEADGKAVEVAALGLRPRDVIEAVIARCPHLVLLDLGLPIEGGGEGLVGPLVDAGLTVAVLTGETDRLLWARCSAAGASVVLSKTEPLDQLTGAVERLLAGDHPRPHQRAELAALRRRADEERAKQLRGFEQLTARERGVVHGLVAGHSLRRLADDRGVSLETVRTQAKSVMRKLGVGSQLEVVARASSSGWTEGDW